MIAAIVNGKSCIVLSIDLPPYGLGAAPAHGRSGEWYRRATSWETDSPDKACCIHDLTGVGSGEHRLVRHEVGDQPAGRRQLAVGRGGLDGQWAGRGERRDGDGTGVVGDVQALTIRAFHHAGRVCTRPESGHDVV